VTDNLATQLQQRLAPEYLGLIRAAGELASDLGAGLYLVGGAARDLLLGQASFDIDLVVEGDAPRLASLLAQQTGGQVVVHHRFGTAKLSIRNLTLDLSTARSETYLHPGALPAVRPSSIKNDLARRDFTINSMAIRLNRDDFGQLLDPFEGEKDLARKLIRILHEKSFVDDATRMLRAIRYEQRFDFWLEPNTENLLRRDISKLHTISGDRIRHELELILKEELPEKPLRRAGDLGLLRTIYPSLRGNGWMTQRFQEARSLLHPPPLGLYFSLLLYHLSQAEAEDVIARLKMPRAISRVILDTLRLKQDYIALESPDLSPSGIYHLLENRSFPSLLACVAATDSPLITSRLHLYLDKLRHVRTSLNGTALQQMGVPPGPRVGEVLKALQEAKLDGQARTKQEEIDLVRAWLSRGG